MMQDEELIKRLSHLIQLDIDAIDVYEKVLEQIEDRLIHFRLTCFKEDHLQHVTDLTAELKTRNAALPQLKNENITLRDHIHTTEAAIKTLLQNEELTHTIYQEAARWVISESTRNIIKKNFQDEKKHLSTLEKILDDNNWQQLDKEQIKLEKSLNQILSYLYQSKDNYAEAAEKVNNHHLLELCKYLAQERNAMISALENEMTELGFNPVSTSSFLGMGQTLYFNLKAQLSGGNPQTIIHEIKRNEDLMRAQYNLALEQHLPSNTRELLEEQVRHIENYLYKIQHLV